MQTSQEPEEAVATRCKLSAWAEGVQGLRGERVYVVGELLHQTIRAMNRRMQPCANHATQPAPA